MLTAVITVVIDDKEGIYEQDVVEAKTENALNAKLKRILFDYIKSFHVDNGYLEEESDEYCKSIAGDIVGKSILLHVMQVLDSSR